MQVAFEMGDRAYVDTAIVVTGDRFPDALAASPVAYRRTAPVLFAKSGAKALPLATEDALYMLWPSNVIIVGNRSAVTTEAEAAIRQVGDGESPIAVTRWSGADDYATSAAVAEGATALGWLRWTSTGLATGLKFQDGLAGGIAMGAKGGPLMLIPRTDLSDPAEASLKKHRAAIDSVTIFGGTAVVAKPDVDIAVLEALK
jgi:hypothetical protein